MNRISANGYVRESLLDQRLYLIALLPVNEEISWETRGENMVRIYSSRGNQAKRENSL